MAYHLIHRNAEQVIAELANLNSSVETMGDSSAIVEALDRISDILGKIHDTIKDKKPGDGDGDDGGSGHDNPCDDNTMALIREVVDGKTKLAEMFWKCGFDSADKIAGKSGMSVKDQFKFMLDNLHAMQKEHADYFRDVRTPGKKLLKNAIACARQTIKPRSAA